MIRWEQIYEKRNAFIYFMSQEVDETLAPRYTVGQVGKRFGITRQRVGQINRKVASQPELYEQYRSDYQEWGKDLTINDK